MAAEEEVNPDSRKHSKQNKPDSDSLFVLAIKRIKRAKKGPPTFNFVPRANPMFKLSDTLCAF